MTTIVCISDTHNQHALLNLPEGDILIHAGDITGMGTKRELVSFSKWLDIVRINYKEVILVPGNHDRLFEEDEKSARQIFKRMKNVHILIDESIQLEGINFHGSPYTLNFKNWSFMADEGQLDIKYKSIPDDTQVLITHGPPYGILDRNAQGNPCGSIALKYALMITPSIKYHIFGHIHEGYGSRSINGKEYMNVSSRDGYYKISNNPVSFIF